MKYLFLSLGLVSIAACGSSPSGPNTLNLVSTASGTGSFDVSFNSGADIYTVEIEGDMDLLFAEPALDLNTFDRSSNPISGTGMYASIGDHSSVSLLQTEGAINLTAAQYQRLTAGPVAQSGVVNLSGNYIAFLTNPVDDTLTFIADGDAALTVNLNNATVSGEVTNRILRNKDTIVPIGTTLADLTLNSTNLSSNGTFEGSTSGGGFPASAVTDASYQGLIAGPNSEEAVGVVTLRHLTAATIDETGIFAFGH